MYKIVSNYRNDAELRKSFNELAEKTFGLNFENWYQNGLWGDNYNPYSVVVDRKVVANVSVNKTSMLYNGEVKQFLQLGTVMTDESYRNRGYIRKIMEQIDEEYNEKIDGMYLFANDSVLEFYPKFGFKKSKEYIYSKCVSNTGECQFKKVIMDRAEAWSKLQAAMSNNVFHGRLDMKDNPELILFYVTQFMQESVYFHKQTNTYVVADIEENQVFIHNVFSDTLEDFNQVIQMFGKNIKRVICGFVPEEVEGYVIEELYEEDCTFFIKGREIDFIEREKLRIPSLSHA